HRTRCASQTLPLPGVSKESGETVTGARIERPRPRAGRSPARGRHFLHGRFLWNSCGMQRCQRLKKLYHVTCIVVRSKGNSDPFAAGRTYNPLVAEFLHGFPCAFSAVAERNDMRRCGHTIDVTKGYPAIFTSAVNQHRS